MTWKHLLSILFLVCASVATSVAQGPSSGTPAAQPIVTMSITPPDGQTKEVTVAESGLARITLGDGSEFGFRPTIQDSKPWTRVVVTVFKLPTTSSSTQLLGEIEVKTGAAAVKTKTSPVFQIRVPKVDPPPTTT